jgi:hypothetical protein
MFGLTAITSAQSPKDSKAPGAKDMWVVVKADLFEVDDAAYQALVKAPWRSLEEIEREFFGRPKDKAPKPPTLFELLDKQKPLASRKDIVIDPGQEVELLNVRKVTFLQLSPESLRDGFVGGGPPPVVEEILSLRARVVVSPDRRSVRIQFREESVALEGVTKQTVRVDGKDKPAETPFVQKATVARTRDIPDGGMLLLAITHRPRELREKGHWLVARVQPQIVIKAEEKVLRAKDGK